MTASYRHLSFHWRRLPVLAATCLVASVLSPRAHAAANCDDRFVIVNVPTVFDGYMYDAVVMRSRAVTIETGTFGSWRPEEEKSGAAALTLYHQRLRETRVDVCPLIPPDLPNSADTWKLYQATTAATIGDGTVISDQLDTAVDGAGVRILGWDTREARFTRMSPTGTVQAVQYHFILINGTTGLRIILTAPPPAFEDALTDLRFLLSRLSLPGSHDN